LAVYQACAESLASEHASRLAAMQRADQNIDEMLAQLQHVYHQQRQNQIDSELFDVIASFTQ
jgi:F-type H+-transporting ATPase subunit gamma